MNTRSGDEDQRTSRKQTAESLYERAGRAWNDGRLRTAFRLFLASAESGNRQAWEILAYFYDCGVGVGANQEEALRWYRRAYRCGSYLAANNIGVIWRTRGKLGRAVGWFERALKLGDEDARLEIARTLLLKGRDRRAVEVHLRKAIRATSITEGTKEEAKRLLLTITHRSGSAPRPGAPRSGRVVRP